jgi:hypothetical protein
MATNAYGWGRNLNGEVGDSSQTGRSSPVAVVGNYSFKKIEGSGSWFLALDSTSLAYVWGLNSSSQLGTGNTTNYSSPVAVAGGRSFIDISAGTLHGGGIATDNLIWMWGANTSGQLGDGSRTASASPVAILGGRSYIKISCSGDHTLAIEKSTGYCWAWGNNSLGLLGVGNTTSYSSPVAVLGDRSYSEVSCGAATSYALEASSGVIYAWGSGANGRIGNNTRNNYSSPVAVSGGRSYSVLDAGSAMALAIQASDGNCYGWGSNSQGLLGTGNITSYSSPTVAVGGRSFTSVSGGSSHSQGISGDAGFGWGANIYGQLGVNQTTNSYSSPVGISGGLTLTCISAANTNSIGFYYVAPVAGGHIKKWCYVNWANVKKVNSVATANIKKLNGVTA